MLTALYDYAIREQLLLPPGYTNKLIRAYISLDREGNFLGIMPGEKDKIPCPDIGSMANSGDKCNVLAEKRSILFPGKEEERKKYAAKAAYFCKALDDAAKIEPRVSFCLNVIKDKALSEKIITELNRLKLDGTKVISFMIDGQIIFEMPKVQAWWGQFRQQFAPSGKGTLCLITGKPTVPAATVPPISGLAVVGGHARGDALICFDKDAFCSYGFKQAANAPVSEEAFAGVKAALDKLLEDAPVLAGMKFVHWYDKPVPETNDIVEQALGSHILDEDDGDEDDINPVNPYSARLEADALIKSVETGSVIHKLPNEYYILLLSGVGGRVMVRSYQRGSYQRLRENLEQWQNDLFLINSRGSGLMKPCKLQARFIRLLTRQKSDRNIFDRMSKELAGLTQTTIQAIINGSPLPDSIAARSLAYIRSQMIGSGQEETVQRVPDPWACQWLKVWLCRRERMKFQKEELMVEYNEKHPEAAYHCGALVAVYASIQAQAMGELNANLIDRYYASASQTPALVLGQLARLSNYHLGKLERLKKYLVKYYIDLRDQVACAVGQEIPAVLSLEQQAYFALGYYQMCAKLEKDKLARKAAKTDAKG